MPNIPKKKKITLQNFLFFSELRTRVCDLGLCLVLLFFFFFFFLDEMSLWTFFSQVARFCIGVGLFTEWLGNFPSNIENFHSFLTFWRLSFWRSNGEIVWDWLFLNNIFSFIFPSLFIHSGVLCLLELMLVMYIFVESSVSLRSSNFSA